MKIRSTRLPGIGEKYTLHTSKGTQAILILHRDGRRQFYGTPAAEEDPELVLELKDEEARVLGALLLGIEHEVEERAREKKIRGNVEVEWLEFGSGCSLVGQTIEESAIRSKTGVTVIGIQREGEMLGAPTPDETLKAGDILMVTGSEEDIKDFEKVCRVGEQ